MITHSKNKVPIPKSVICSLFTDGQTDGQTDTKVNTDDTLSWFQDVFHQSIIKDRSNNSDAIKNYKSSVGNVRLVCLRRFLLLVLLRV